MGKREHVLKGDRVRVRECVGSDPRLTWAVGSYGYVTHVTPESVWVAPERASLWPSFPTNEPSAFERVEPLKLSLRRVSLTQGGYYGPGGQYFGHGKPLFRYTDAEGNDRYLRATDRADAKQELRRRYPGCRFYR